MVRRAMVFVMTLALSDAFFTPRSAPRAPTLRRSADNDSEVRLREKLEETSTTLTSNQATRLAAIADRDPAQEEVMAALTKELDFVPLVGSRVCDALDALGATLSSAADSADAADAAAGALSSPPARPRIVVLGTGWGAAAFLGGIDTAAFDVTIVSPRNYFLFTPMLAGP
jgi:hypothetical protein